MKITLVILLAVLFSFAGAAGPGARSSPLPAPIVPPVPRATENQASAPDDEMIWPTYQHDFQRTGRSPYRGITTRPVVTWSYPFTGSFYGASGFAMAGPDRLYVRWSSGIVVLDAAGNLVRKIGSGGECLSTPTLGSDGRIYDSHGDGFYAWANDGTELWHVPIGTSCIYAPTALDEARGNVYIGLTPYLIAVDPADGSQKWAVQIAPQGNSPAVTDTPALGPDGTIYKTGGFGLGAVSPDGNPRWLFMNYGGESNPAVADDGTVYGARNGMLVAFDPEGSIKWIYPFGDRVCSVSPAVAVDGTIYLTTLGDNWPGYGSINAITADGSLKWRYQVSNWVCESPVTDNQGNVFFCDDGGICYGLDANGELLWRVTVGGYRTSPLIAQDGVMYMMRTLGPGSFAVGRYVESSSWLYLPLVSR